MSTLKLKQVCSDKHSEVGLRLEFVIFVSVFTLISFSSNITYGQLANSLEELESQVKNETGYRSELENYVTSHNISIVNQNVKDRVESTPLPANELSMSESELMVKIHMTKCQSVADNESVTYDFTFPPPLRATVTLMGDC